MDTKAKAFVERRQAAHQAGTLDIGKDPLVQAAIDAQRQTAEVMARWKDMRDAGTPKRWPAKRTRRTLGTQAD